MTLILTPSLLKASYDLLVETQPFCKWNLPDSEDIRHVVSNYKREFGRVDICGKKISILYSRHMIGHLVTLLATTAHEMIHIHQHMMGVEVDHGTAFKKWSAEVCRHHRDFDPMCFG